MTGPRFVGRPQSSSLLDLLAQVPPNTPVAYRALGRSGKGNRDRDGDGGGDDGQHEQVLALVTAMSGGPFWVRLFTGGPEVEGNRIRPDVAGLVTLFAGANIPLECGWEPWQQEKA